ncbi:lysozyme inhibitor LprI family protein [Novispirillum itersonii]|uniref:lysozyme inhibitor LprI family protein n=1 Tax=Novispirillum itersonii TaxID=189 RepID=UPI00039F3116|nr:lysozyme inhibitor LprI family protein [Novispirillum itersonii]
MMKKTVISLMTATGLWLTAGAAQAQENGPSFDCSAGKSLGEQILCSDPGLAARDRLMAETYKVKSKGADGDAVKTAQRAWLKQRDSACGIAGKKAQESLDPQTVWSIAPCLVKQYDARLAELGAAAPAAVPLPAGVWHPACVGAATEAAERGIDLTLCQAGTAHVPATAHTDPPDGFETEGLYEGFPDYNYYQKVGALSDGRQLVLTTYNGGGTGFFSLVSAATVKKGKDGHDRLTLQPVGDGGDRCNGGISDVALKGQSVIITRSLTPAALADLLKVPEPLVTQLPDCAVCCAADVTTHQTVDGDPQVDSVAIQDIEEQALGDGKLEACVGKALETAAGKTLKGPEMAALGKSIAACEKFVVK